TPKRILRISAGKAPATVSRRAAAVLRVLFFRAKRECRMNHESPTNRTQVVRLPKRGDYSEATIHSILDAGFLCHFGFVVDGQPFVIPTSYGRSGNTLFIHGSAASRMLRTLAGGVDVCVTVTLLDGLVLALSAFHHSMNYRSFVLFGTAMLVESA